MPPPPPCLSDPDASIPFESPHPYGNNADCTWTYDNGSAGFRFHFSLLDTEKAKGSVRLLSDSSVTAQGFTVDAVQSC